MDIWVLHYVGILTFSSKIPKVHKFIFKSVFFDEQRQIYSITYEALRRCYTVSRALFFLVFLRRGSEKIRLSSIRILFSLQLL